MATLSSPTLQTLITSVRGMLNQPDRNNSFWTDDDLTRYLNDAVNFYFTEVVMFDEGQFVTTANLDIVANTETVALPSDCFKVRTLWKSVSNGFVALTYQNQRDEGYLTQGGTSSDLYWPSYCFRGNSLVLRPTPNFSETAGLKLEYVQFPETMINGGDSLSSQISPIFKQMIEMYAIYKAKVKESLVNGVSVHTVAEQNLGAIYKQFRDGLECRSKQPTYVRPFNPEY